MEKINENNYSNKITFAIAEHENNETFHDNNASSNGKPDCNIYLSMTIKDC